PDPNAKDENDKMTYSKGALLVSPVLGNYPHLWKRQALDPEQIFVDATISTLDVSINHLSRSPDTSTLG
ncbi:9204_t:CDS:1, partial [Paraglomus brasilianum]